MVIMTSTTLHSNMRLFSNLNDKIEVEEVGRRREAGRWMRNIVNREKVTERVYETAKRFMERFLTMTEIGETELQLLAATCLLVSSKLVGERVITAKSLVDYTDHNIWIQELLDWEVLLLSKLGWDVYLEDEEETSQILDNLHFDEDVIIE